VSGPRWSDSSVIVYPRMPAQPLGSASRLSCPPAVLSRVLDGEAVLLDLAGGRYYGMNEVATFAWERIVEGVSFGELVERVQAEFEVDEATATKDLAALVEALLERGLAVRA